MDRLSTWQAASASSASASRITITPPFVGRAPYHATVRLVRQVCCCPNQRASAQVAIPPDLWTGFAGSAGSVSGLGATGRGRGALRHALGPPRINAEEACSAFRDAAVSLFVACGAGRAILTGTWRLSLKVPRHQA